MARAIRPSASPPLCTLLFRPRPIEHRSGREGAKKLDGKPRSRSIRSSFFFSSLAATEKPAIFERDSVASIRLRQIISPITRYSLIALSNFISQIDLLSKVYIIARTYISRSSSYLRRIDTIFEFTLVARAYRYAPRRSNGNLINQKLIFRVSL